MSGRTYESHKVGSHKQKKDINPYVHELEVTVESVQTVKNTREERTVIKKIEIVVYIIFLDEH